MTSCFNIIVNSPDPETTEWRYRVLANGGFVNDDTLRNVDRFVRNIKIYGLRDRFARLSLFCGDDLNACLVPLFNSLGYGNPLLGNQVDTNNNFVSANYTERGTSGGLLGNGTNAFLFTNLALPASLQNDCHCSAVVCVSGANVLQSYIGSDTLSTPGVSVILRNASVEDVYRASMQAGAFSLSIAPVRATGHHIANRVNSTQVQGGIASAALATAASDSGVPSTMPFVIFARGMAASFSSARLGGYSIGRGMTAAQVLDFGNIMREFQQALGRANYL